MKKITLSAAILAFAMMGCSESGLDNSMASTTSDAQKEKIIEKFKTALDEFTEIPDSDASPVLKKSGEQWSGTVTDDSGIYRLRVYADVDLVVKKGQLPRYQGRTYSLIMKKNNAVPNVWFPYNAPDTKTYLFSVCVQGCSDDGTCQKHEFEGKTGEGFTPGVERTCSGLGGVLGSKMGIVSMASVTANGGEVSLTATVRKNLSNDVAKEVMKKYMFHDVIKFLQNQNH